MLRLILALLLLAPLPAVAQSTARTTPLGAVSSNLSSTITLTGTFQSIQTANSERKSCLIQNNGTNNMNVYFGPIASATAAKSVVLAPSATVNCTAGGIVLTDQVSITGTTADAFLANFQ
jgi:hypothetical protein